ncbi:MAG: methyltransferase domain-containing protein [Coleofasciculus sp. Co-bin14]|nr:methyltransferase domain-containing protein [Coleofasciculus sp. Co-bin14]
MRLKQILSFLALCVSVASLLIWQAGQSTPLSQAQPTPTPTSFIDQSVSPYVPTPNEVVIEMMKMAGVTKNDVVYDLGSGDGRIVIIAAKEFGAKGVGVEIDPELIKESNENARLAGVSDRVNFIQKDLFQADLSEATVVTLYLLPEVMQQLQPKLLGELKPGTRIISHQFDMKEWKPDRSEVLRQPSRLHLVHYWIIPAQVAGTWQWTMPTPTGTNRYRLQLRQQFQKVSGTMSTENGEIPLAEAKLTGDQLSFKITHEAGITMQFNGRVSDNTITGSVEILREKQAELRDWVAVRQE